jgi:4-hydroxy-3-methylbut-2-enyl diphosphate reductase IspH
VIGLLREALESIQIISSPDEVDSLKVPDPRRLAYLTQTTLSIDDTAAIVRRLKERFPEIISPPSHDIGYATQNRHKAAKSITPNVESVLVVGAKNSSNSNRPCGGGAQCWCERVPCGKCGGNSGGLGEWTEASWSDRGRFRAVKF